MRPNALDTISHLPMDRPHRVRGPRQLATAFITLILVTFLTCFSIMGTGNLYDRQNTYVLHMRDSSRSSLVRSHQRLRRRGIGLWSENDGGLSLIRVDVQAKEQPQINLADPENYIVIDFIEELKSLSRIPLNSVSPVTKGILKLKRCTLPDLVYPTPIQNKTLDESVPKILHLTWKSERLPGMAAQWVTQWRRTNPDWEVWFWTDHSARDFVLKHFQAYTVFKKYKVAIERADAIRYFVLYEFGGVYADLDIEPLASLNSIVDTYTCFLSQEPDEHTQLLRPWSLNKFKYLACNAVMACRKKHPYFKYVMDNLARNFAKNKNVLDRTGPIMLSKMHVEYVEKFTKDQCENVKQRIGIMPPELFIPTYDYLQTDTIKNMCRNQTKLLPGQQRVCADLKDRKYLNQVFDISFTVHHWFHTWTKQGHTTNFRKGFSYNSTHIHNVLPEAKVVKF